MKNQLAEEKSLYLQQHANNPVHWWPWCDEAFQAAKDHNKPIILSIGYSSCHWCHVMAHECFEDSYIADLMNTNFICIKVDREERPDIDQLYMESVQMITQQGGWPLNAFCLPDGRPFFGGTYFPAEDRGQGIVPWPQLLMRISEYFKNKPEELEENATNIVKNLQMTNSPAGSDASGFSNSALIEAAKTLCREHDDEWGGFGQAPKFPPSMILDFLFSISQTNAAQSDSGLSQNLHSVIQTTLRAMAHGGLYDHIGGGFARYSVDRFWVVPHFEKMLYDNALLIDTYLKGYLQYRTPIYKAIVEESITFLKRSMASHSAFGSSIDADTDGEEGKYYVYLKDEITQVLGDKDAKAFCELYHITESGNFEGRNIPVLVEGDFQKRQDAQALRDKLLKYRQTRTHPSFDPKILLAWNALTVKALAHAGFYLGNPDYLKQAQETADFICDKLTHNGRLFAILYDDSPSQNAYLDDYAFLIEALLALGSCIHYTDPSASETYYARAKSLMDKLFEHFKDEREVGFYFTSNDHESLLSRKKVWWDNAIPCGNSSLVHGLSGLFALYGDTQYQEELSNLRKAHSAMITRAPNGVAHALSAYTQDVTGIVVLKIRDHANFEALREGLANKPYRKVFIRQDESLSEAYQLCVGTQCLEPTSDIEVVLKGV